MLVLVMFVKEVIYLFMEFYWLEFYCLVYDY